MQTTLHINFAGCCQEAFNFYGEVLGATMGDSLTYGQSPAASQVPEDWQDKIINADIELNGVRIAGGDLLPVDYKPPAGFAILLTTDSEEQTKMLYDALSLEGSILVPLQETFWTSCYAIVTDKFGVTWKLSYSGH